MLYNVEGGELCIVEYSVSNNTIRLDNYNSGEWLLWNTMEGGV